MQRYSQHRPTGFDRQGAFLPDSQQWFVVPVSRTRGSGPLDESNFATALAALGGESDTCEVHRFGHWGPGWYEIILLHPGRESEGDEIEAALSDYPVLDDEDYSNREYTLACDTWSGMRIKDRIEVCSRFDISIMAARREYMPSDDNGGLLQYLTQP